MGDNNTDTIGSRLICCFRCRNLVAAHDDIIKNSFVAIGGRGYLLSHVMNVKEGPKAERQLISGAHSIADVFCGDCEQLLGWKYYKAHQQQNMYKEGKFVLAKSKVAKAHDSTFY